MPVCLKVPYKIYWPNMAGKPGLSHCDTVVVEVSRLHIGSSGVRGLVRFGRVSREARKEEKERPNEGRPPIHVFRSVQAHGRQTPM